jgi:hypothetical protein
MGYRSFLVASALAVVASGALSCSSAVVADPVDNVTKPIGPEGGIIEVGGAVVTFPKGALATTTTITVAAQGGSAVPEGFVALSKVFKCEPSGTDFAQPVEMRMPFTDDGQGGTLFWSTGSDPTFKDLGGKVEGTTMVATIQHFSSGFVGRKK